MERKQILEMLTVHCAGVASTKENGLVATKVYLDDLADELVNLFAIHNVVGQSEQLVCYKKCGDTQPYNDICLNCGSSINYGAN